MDSKEWLTRRTPAELLEHYALLRHLPQTAYSGHAHRRAIKAELERRALRLAQLMRNMDNATKPTDH